MAYAVAVLANWIPDPTPEFGANPNPFVAMMLAGFVIAIAGHMYRSRTALVIGIGLIFLATFLLPLAINLSKS